MVLSPFLFLFFFFSLFLFLFFSLFLVCKGAVSTDVSCMYVITIVSAEDDHMLFYLF